MWTRVILILTFFYIFFINFLKHYGTGSTGCGSPTLFLTFIHVYCIIYGIQKQLKKNKYTFEEFVWQIISLSSNSSKHLTGCTHQGQGECVLVRMYLYTKRGYVFLSSLSICQYLSVRTVLFTPYSSVCMCTSSVSEPKRRRSKGMAATRSITNHPLHRSRLKKKSVAQWCGLL